MDKNNILFYLVTGFGLIFLLPAAESAGENLNQIATFLVIGYWGGMGLCLLIILFKNLFADFRFGVMLYNLWLFVSLMCVAVGVLAIVDEGVDKARWAVVLILYGATVGYFNRKEL